MKILTIIILILSGLCMLAAFSFAAEPAGKKILLIDSYHQGYAWSDGIVSAVREVLKNTEAELRIFRMDTKRYQSVEFIQQAALKAKTLIESYKPDVVIACDDNVSKYLIQPYYKNAGLPIIFCGVNWDASVYGYPYTNATGMVEVELIEPLVAQLRQFAKGNRIGFLAISGTTSKNNSQHHAKILGKPYDKVYFVQTYQDWKACFLKLQDEVDILIIGNPQGISDWDENDFIDFAAKHTRIPTGATIPWVKKFTLMGYIRIPEEQGQWAATAALKILKGTRPSAIPMTQNRQGKLFINMRMAKRLGITFDPAVFKRAEIVQSYPGKKILFIDSYHEGYAWSDGVVNGVKDVLKDTEIDLRIFRMDTKRYQSVEFIQQAALRAKALIESYEPDVVIACDDNASKYLIQPYYKNANLPVVFCGVNWPASDYGYPYTNTTGMVEVEMIQQLVSLLRQYAKGDRIGRVTIDGTTARKQAKYHAKILGKPYNKIYFVHTYKDYKECFLKLQDEVDMLIFGTPQGLLDWDEKDFVPFALRHTKIPTGATLHWAKHYAMIGYVRVPEEQGIWAAQSTIKILDGTNPSDIPMTVNHQGKLILNLKFVKKLGVVIDRAVFSRAEILE